MDIRECVIVTKGPRGPHVAAMGVIMDEGLPWVIRPYPETETLANLRQSPTAWLNFVDDAWPIVAAALGQGEKLPTVADPWGGWRLEEAVQCVRVRVMEFREDGEGPPRLALAIQGQRTMRPYRGISRSFGVLIETCVAATRIPWLGLAPVKEGLARAEPIVAKTGSVSDHRALALIRQQIRRYPEEG